MSILLLSDSNSAVFHLASVAFQADRAGGGNLHRLFDHIASSITSPLQVQ